MKPFLDNEVWRGIWKQNTNYEVNDIVDYNKTLYIANTKHLSDTTINLQNWNYYTSILDLNVPPLKLKDYKVYNKSICVAYKIFDYVYSFVHFSADLVEDFVYNNLKDICENNTNGIYKNYICFYSPYYNSELINLQNKYNNFTFYYMPLIAFSQINKFIDVNSLPPIIYKYTRKFSCLQFRPMQQRAVLHDFLVTNNLVYDGYVSYRNKNFINFEDKYYPNDLIYAPQRHIWRYPHEDFLFDFAIETHSVEPAFMTEKCIKGFFWGKIPVITGCRNIMNYLEQFGFDIFRDVIDYTYDIQKDPKIQIDMYLQQIQKIISIDANQIKNLKERLQSNRSLICKLVKRSQVTLESINENTIYISENRQKYLGY